jgi:hypothetical protein
MLISRLMIAAITGYTISMMLSILLLVHVKKKEEEQ